MRLPPDVQERVMPKFDWIRLLQRAPGKSVFYTHELCGKRCERVNRVNGYTSKLSASTISHVATVLALQADVDGTDAWMGLTHLAAATKRHRVTVNAALKHLEVKQLVYVHVRGGTLGIPRTWASIYVLTRPPDAVMAAAGLGEVSAAYEWFTRPGTGGAG